MVHLDDLNLCTCFFVVVSPFSARISFIKIPRQVNVDFWFIRVLTWTKNNLSFASFKQYSSNIQACLTKNVLWNVLSCRAPGRELVELAGACYIFNKTSIKKIECSYKKMKAPPPCRESIYVVNYQSKCCQIVVKILSYYSHNFVTRWLGWILQAHKPYIDRCNRETLNPSKDLKNDTQIFQYYLCTTPACSIILIYLNGLEDLCCQQHPEMSVRRFSKRGCWESQGIK